MNFLLFEMWTPEEMKELQASLLAAAQGVNVSVGACTGLSAADAQGWKSFYENLVNFCSQIPVWTFPTGSGEVMITGQRANQLEYYRDTLAAWTQLLTTRMAQAKCQLSYPQPVPKPDPLAPLTYVATALGLLGVGWIASKVVEGIRIFHPAR